MTNKPTTTTAPRRRPYTRKDEVIGGGYFVFRRGKKTGRVGIKSRRPYEHGSFEQAIAEARRLAALHKGETFEVFQTSGVSWSSSVEIPAAILAEAANAEMIVVDPLAALEGVAA